MTFCGPEIIKIYSIDHYGPEMYEIYKKNSYGPEKIGFERNNLIFNFMSNIKLKSFEFSICDGCQHDHHVYKFLNESTAFSLKVLT